MGNTIELNFKSLEDMTGGDASTMMPLLQVIIKGLKSYPKEIDEAFMAGNHGEVARLAHKYKSSIAYLESEDFLQMLSVLESLKTQDLPIELIGESIKKVESYSEQALEVVIDKVASIMS